MITSKAKPFRLAEAVPEPYDHPKPILTELPLLDRARDLVDGIASRLDTLRQEVEAVEMELENAQKLLVDIEAISRRVGGGE